MFRHLRFFLWCRGWKRAGGLHIAREGGWVHRTWTGSGSGSPAGHVAVSDWQDAREAFLADRSSGVTGEAPACAVCAPHGSWWCRGGDELAGCVAASRSAYSPAPPAEIIHPPPLSSELRRER